MNHLRECFDFYDSLPNVPGKGGLTELALWFHDFVYDVYCPQNNKLKSAQKCQEFLTSIDVGSNLSTLVGEYICNKVHHYGGSLLADINLWILSAPSKRFNEYEEQIRYEYQCVDYVTFVLDRREIMRKILNRNYIYNDHLIRTMLEERARVNLELYRYELKI